MITVGNKIENEEDLKDSVGCAVFDWTDEDFCYVECYEGAAEIRNENGESEYYEIENQEQFLELMTRKLNITFGFEKPYIPICE